MLYPVLSPRTEKDMSGKTSEILIMYPYVSKVCTFINAGESKAILPLTLKKIKTFILKNSDNVRIHYNKENINIDS